MRHFLRTGNFRDVDYVFGVLIFVLGAVLGFRCCVKEESGVDFLVGWWELGRRVGRRVGRKEE